MKTTIELSDALFDAAKTLAMRQQVTLRSLIEEGLRNVLNASQQAPRPAFKLTNASVRGEEVLLPDPRDWRELEDQHLADNLASPLVAPSTSTTA